MALGATLLAATAAVFLGVEPVASKRGLGAGGTWVQNTVTAIGTRTAAFWVVLLVVGGPDPLAGLTPLAVAVFGGAGALASGVGRLLFYTGIDRVGSSLGSAFANTRPLFAVVLAVLVLGEPVTRQLGVGVAVLVGGLALLSVSRGGDLEGWRRQDLLFPLVAATMFASGNVARRFAFTVTPTTVLQAVAVGETFGFAVVLAYALSGRGPGWTLTRRVHGFFLLGGGLSAVGILSLFAALSVGAVSIVDPIAATTPLFTALTAAVLLRDLERVTPPLLVGVCLVVVGVALVTTA